MKWRDADLSAEGFDLLYKGRIYVRPIGRGVVLKELELAPELDELFPEGEYEAEIRIRIFPTAQEALRGV